MQVLSIKNYIIIIVNLLWLRVLKDSVSHKVALVLILLFIVMLLIIVLFLCFEWSSKTLFENNLFSPASFDLQNHLTLSSYFCYFIEF